MRGENHANHDDAAWARGHRQAARQRAYERQKLVAHGQRCRYQEQGDDDRNPDPILPSHRKRTRGDD